MSVADEIKTRLDIVNYIQQTVPLKKAGRTYKACCPFHQERTPSFVVDPDRQSWRCYGACSTGGDIFNFAMKQQGWTFPEALRELGKLAGVEVEPQTPEQQVRDAHHDSLRGLVGAAADYFHEQLRTHLPAYRYAREKRGFTDETIDSFAIGYAPGGWTTTLDYLRQLGYDDDSIIEVGLARRSEGGRVYDYFRNRLIIPIRDVRGRVIGFGARALDPEDTPKYLNSPQTPLFDKSATLFGLDAARDAIRGDETAVIVEGYMDAIQAHQAGFRNVIAQMGTALTEPQLKQIAPRWAKRIVLALDADAAGQNATMRSLEVARNTLQADYGGRLSIDIRVLQIPGAKDPDDLIRETPDQWAALVEGAQPVAEYVIAVETGSLPPNATVQEREAVARRLLPILLATESDLYKRDNLQKLAMRLRIGERDLLYWAAEQQKIAESKAPRQPPPSDEPPPIDYESMMPPPADDDDAEMPDGAARPVQPAPRSTSARWEVDCLRALLQQPDRIFSIDRRLRELAGTDETLRRGPLRDFEPDDFTDADHRALMHVLVAAVAQDALEPVDYLQANVDGHLRDVLNGILLDDFEQLRPRLRHGLSADLGVVLKRSVPLDLKRNLLRNALRLRHQRLVRECADYSYLIMDSTAEDATEQFADFDDASRLSIMARRIIEDDLGMRQQDY
jgi:DNA primase